MAQEPKEIRSDALHGAEREAEKPAGGDGERPVEAALTIPGMGSNHCAGIVNESIRRLEGIDSIDTNISNHRAVVRFDPKATGLDEIRRAVEKAGYEVTAAREKGRKTAPDQAEADEESEVRFLRQVRRRIWIAAVPTTIIMVLMAVHMLWTPIPGYLAIIAVLAFPAVFIAGASTHKSAFRSVTNRTANMDVLISMGSLPPYFIGLAGFIFPMVSFIEMGATIMTFHVLGRFLESRAKGRASHAIRKLLTLGAKTARVERDGEEQEVRVDELQKGDIMVVRPGEKIPTDGEIVEGESHVDESIATGESVPASKEPGDSVIGATINKEGRLKVRATRVGSETFLAQVIRLVDEAQSSKVPIQEFADRVTGYFVPAVIGVAALSFFAWLFFAEPMRGILEWGATFLPWVNPELGPVLLAILSGVAVLVIACPCALGLATPTALMVGSGMGAEQGILIRSGEAIQMMKDIRVVVLDKTGTITRGEPRLADVVAAEGGDETELLRLAAAVEAASEHPIGEAIVAGARERGIDLPEVKSFRSAAARGVIGEVEGRQVVAGARRLFRDEKIDFSRVEKELERLEGQGKTAILVAIDGEAAGVVAVADTVKEESAEAIAQLKKLGLRTVMITGDNERAAREVAREVGLDEVMAEILPEGKADAIRRLQEEHGQVVAMVGDGINDAPALKQANVGIAIGAGADVAIEAADITLVRGELTKVVEAIDLSRATFRKIVQNLFWAWIYNVVAVPVAALGLLHPMLGVIAMTASSLSVVGNSLLLRRSGRKRARELPGSASPSRPRE